MECGYLRLWKLNFGTGGGSQYTDSVVGSDAGDSNGYVSE